MAAVQPGALAPGPDVTKKQKNEVWSSSSRKLLSPLLLLPSHAHTSSSTPVISANFTNHFQFHVWASNKDKKILIKHIG
jgi:hypothetical protein